ncbi:hypothetical protein [Leifsonia sp. AG29]|uniref:hypothetical protein n=1 Tax=Leifsonia sp. AG29 TaxID=2598860 RepID=UPI00131E8DD9|nr:hypothetical protein [Leifsonia sp. AG29]
MTNASPPSPPTPQATTLGRDSQTSGTKRQPAGLLSRLSLIFGVVSVVGLVAEFVYPPVGIYLVGGAVLLPLPGMILATVALVQERSRRALPIVGMILCGLVLAYWVFVMFATVLFAVAVFGVRAS